MEEYDKVVFSLYFPRKAAQSLTGRIIRLKSGASEVFITLLLLFLCHADITWLSAWACNSLDDYNTICDNHQPKTNLSYSASIFTELSVHKKKKRLDTIKAPHMNGLRRISGTGTTSFMRKRNLTACSGDHLYVGMTPIHGSTKKYQTNTILQRNCSGKFLYFTLKPRIQLMKISTMRTRHTLLRAAISSL